MTLQIAPLDRAVGAGGGTGLRIQPLEDFVARLPILNGGFTSFDPEKVAAFLRGRVGDPAPVPGGVGGEGAPTAGGEGPNAFGLGFAATPSGSLVSAGLRCAIGRGNSVMSDVIAAPFQATPYGLVLAPVVRSAAEVAVQHGINQALDTPEAAQGMMNRAAVDLGLIPVTVTPEQLGIGASPSPGATFTGPNSGGLSDVELASLGITTPAMNAMNQAAPFGQPAPNNRGDESGPPTGPTGPAPGAISDDPGVPGITGADAGGGGGAGGSSHLCTWAARVLGKERATQALRDSFVEQFAKKYPASWKASFKKYQRAVGPLIVALDKFPLEERRKFAERIVKAVFIPFGRTITADEVDRVVAALTRIGTKLAKELDLPVPADILAIAPAPGATLKRAVTMPKSGAAA